MDLNDLSQNPEQVQQLIALLQKLLPQAPQAENKPIKKEIKPRKNKPAKNTGSLNKFDSMADKHLHKEDAAIDKILSQSPKTPRVRKFQPIDVICRACGKKESINPSLMREALDRYKCNKCSTIAAG